MFANPYLIYCDRFVFCFRLFVCLRMRMSTSKQYANVYIKSIFLCTGSIAGVPFDSAGRFRASLLLHTTCVCSYCNCRASCVTTKHKIKWKCGGWQGAGYKTVGQWSLDLVKPIFSLHMYCTRVWKSWLCHTYQVHSVNQWTSLRRSQRAEGGWQTSSQLLVLCQ